MALLVNDSFLAGDGTVQEVAGIDLDAGLVGINEERDAGFGAIQRCGHLGDVSSGVQDPVVVITVAVADLLVVGVNVCTDGLHLPEIERSAFGRSDFTGGHVGVVNRRVGG